MDKLKFTIFSIITLTLLGLVGYWAVATIQSGSEHASTEEIKKLKDENEELKKEAQELKSELGSLAVEAEKEKQGELTVETKGSVPVTANEHQELIDELQKLIDDNVVIKLKSRGTRVGTVQKFLNIYNDTSNRIDNDYGVSTQKKVIEFQKAQGLPGDGEVGKTTFEKMIDWLEK
jgi:murein L,D-transpeptidase YcbB/YkuD